MDDHHNLHRPDATRPVHGRRGVLGAMGERMSEDKVDKHLDRAATLAMRGYDVATKAQHLIWCAEKKELLRQAEEYFRDAAEELSFVKQMR